MKKIVIAPECIEHVYLTPGKEYEVIKELHLSKVFNILDDNGREIVCLYKGCSFLGGKDWIVK